MKGKSIHQYPSSFKVIQYPFLYAETSKIQVHIRALGVLI